MHVVIATLYGITIYLSVLAYIIIIDGPLVAFLGLAPVIVSGAIVALFALDLAVRGVGWAWRRWRQVTAN